LLATAHYRRHRHQEFLRFLKVIDAAVPKHLELHDVRGIWTKTADNILDTLAAYRTRINDSGHQRPSLEAENSPSRNPARV
jgi:hypothetical protein